MNSSKQMKRYKTVLFDLCGTIMQYRLDRLPQIEIKGESIQSTSPLLYACFLEFDRGAVSFERFHAEFMATSEAVFRERKQNGKEILSSTRFRLFLERLDADLGPRRDEIQRLLMDIHLNRVATCLELLPHHEILLREWKDQYAIGLVTNFDDALTVQHVLDREKLTELFGTVIISASFGIRKPGKEIFLAACEALESTPNECLFVGDSWEADIVGAKAVGMDTAWINTDRGMPPTDGPQTDYDMGDLAELSEIL